MRSDEVRYPETSPTAARILSIDNELAALDRVKPKSHVLLFGSVILPLGLLAVGTASVAFPNLRPWLVVIALPSLLYARQLNKNNGRRAQLEKELDELIEQPMGRRPLETGDGR